MLAKWDRTKGRPEPIRALNLVDECENGEPLVRIQDPVRILRPQVIPYLREKVVSMLSDAGARLPVGMFLGVIDAWRPFDRQVRIWDYMWACSIEVWPDLTHAARRRKVCRWVAPVDQKAPPGHCTGAAVDVYLVNHANEILDVSSPYGRFSAAPTYSFGLTEEAQRNRDTLVTAMLGAGFSNCRDEWWHYSYGDAGWAVRMGKDSCPYGIAQLPESEYAQQERLWYVAMRDRQNPFKEGRSA